MTARLHRDPSAQNQEEKVKGNRVQRDNEELIKTLEVRIRGLIT